jgi:hypothetical protein
MDEISDLCEVFQKRCSLVKHEHVRNTCFIRYSYYYKALALELKNNSISIAFEMKLIQ